MCEALKGEKREGMDWKEGEGHVPGSRHLHYSATLVVINSNCQRESGEEWGRFIYSSRLCTQFVIVRGNNNKPVFR